jgi:hypothetical protein
MFFNTGQTRPDAVGMIIGAGVGAGVGVGIGIGIGIEGQKMGFGHATRKASLVRIVAMLTKLG